MASTFIPVDNNILVGLASVATIASIVLGGMWKITNWLRDKFIEVEDHLEGLLDKHEAKDSARHEDNIQRFAVLETQLHTIIKNGTH